MNTKLFIGNLHFSVLDDELRNLFATVGPVLRAEIVRDRFDGHSRGFAFVEMETVDHAKAAIATLYGTRFNGRPVRIQLARSNGAADTMSGAS